MSNGSNKKANLNTKRIIDKKKKAAAEDKQRIVFLMFSVVIFIVILISTIFSDVQQIIYNREQTKLLNAKYTELLEEEASLSSEATKLQDPNYLARRAREKYLYTKEGEKILTFVEEEKESNEE